jgi:dTDP-4-dehydrorhamnose 3,5-epimerase
LEGTVKFTETELQGAYLIDIDPAEDFRGYFARLWCRNEFASHGINIDLVQVSVSHNIHPGTLRGLHFQWPPAQEAKLVRCQNGRVFDVIVDLRPDSPTFTQHTTVELASQTHNAVFVPPGFAHGFQALEAHSNIIYMMSDFFQPELADGVRYNDPCFKITWPLPISCILDRDSNYPDFDATSYANRYWKGQHRMAGSACPDQDNGS